MTVTSSVREITPEFAKQLLSKNTTNRRLSPARLGALSHEMSSGTFQFNGEPIILGSNGSLLDGQHRLAAIVASGRTQTILLVMGVDEGAIHTIDTGRPRSSVDTLNMLGVRSAQIVSAAAAHFYRVMTNTSITSAVPVSYILEVNKRYPQLIYWATKYNASAIVRKKIPGSTFITALTYLDAIAGRRDLADELWTKLESGANMQIGDPILALQNRLLGTANGGLARRAEYVWPGICRVVNALETGERLTRIQMVPNAGRQEQPAKMANHLSNCSALDRFEDLQGGKHTASHAGLALKFQPRYYDTTPVAKRTASQTKAA